MMFKKNKNYNFIENMDAKFNKCYINCVYIHLSLKNTFIFKECEIEDIIIHKLKDEVQGEVKKYKMTEEQEEKLHSLDTRNLNK